MPAATTLLILRRLQEAPFQHSGQEQCPIPDVVEEHSDLFSVQAHHHSRSETVVLHSLLDREGPIQLRFVCRGPGMAVVTVPTWPWVALTEVLQQKLPAAPHGLRACRQHL